MISLSRPGIGVCLAFALLLSSCGSKPHSTASATPPIQTPNLDAEIARATELRRPLVILVMESGLSQVDEDSRALFDLAPGKNETAIFVLLDISVSRNRAEAARFHTVTTPLFLCLTPRGLIVSRNEGPMTKETLLQRLADAAQQAPELDAKLAAFEEAAAKNEDDSAARLELADFLLGRQNAREAIPWFASVAYSASADPARRVRAWVALCRGHLWIAEPEKGRHEARDLINVLGPTTAEARAGGNLILGLQDAKAKRVKLARQEFADAVEAAPESAYGKQAAEEMAKIPGEKK